MKKTKKRKKITLKTKKVSKVKKTPTTKKRTSKKIWSKNVASMKKRIQNSLDKLKKDIKQNASIEVIEKDNNELLILLGECNYVVREFHEHQLMEEKSNK